MSQFKDFDVDQPDVDPTLEGPKFKLGGQEFRCLPVVPGGMIGPIVSTFVRNADGTALRDIDQCLTVIEGLLVEQVWRDAKEGPGEWVPVDDLARWRALIKSKTTLIESAKIAEVFDWILAAYAALNSRPTKPSSL